MSHVQTLIHGKYVIPINSEEMTLHNTSIAIQDGRILDVLTKDIAEKNYSSEKTFNYDHHIIVPGLINTHSHAAMSLFRGIANDLPLMDWLQNHIWPAEQKWVDDQFVEVGTKLAIAEMLRGGITCFNDMYFFAESSAKAAADAGIRAQIGMILLDFPTQYAKSPDEYFSKGLDLFDQYKSHPLVKCAFAPHAPYTVSNAPLERVGILANELELPVHTHLHETRDEIEKSIVKYQMRPIERLHTLGLINRNLIAVHMTHLEEKEIDLLAETKANVVHCPQSNLKLASGFCPVQKLIENEINVSLGTDSCASNDYLDIFSEMHIAALLAKGVSNNAAAFPAHDVLRSVTINAAKALGLDNEIGSIEIGKSADLTIIDIQSLEAQPLYDPIGHTVYATQRNQVSDVWIAGKHILQERKLKTLNEEEILSKTEEWNKTIQN